MTETREQQIERLKKNLLPWMALSEVDGECLRKANPSIENLLYSGEWEHQAHGYDLRSPGANSIFRIGPDYRAEPEYVDLPIKKQYDSKGVLWLGCVRSEAIVAMFNVLPHPFTHLHCLPSLPGFAGFYDLAGAERILLDHVAERVLEGQTVIAKFEVKP